jgi:hypothetical protein
VTSIRSGLGLAALVAPLLASGAVPSRFADDYGAALAAARARGVPLVVDAWAPW